jgi:MscS family membrane protein
MNSEIYAWSIPWGEIVLLFGWVFGFLLVGKIIQLGVKRLAKAERHADHALFSITAQALSRPVPFLFFIVGLKIGLGGLSVNAGIATLLADVIAVLLTVSIAYFVYSLIDIVNYLLISVTGKTATKLDDMMVPMVRKSLRVVVVLLALVQIAQILSDKPITSIIAGLGVGGLAVALAAQETIKNFFGSLVIFADKPFELDERIRVGGHDGVVEEVGFRSTRIRTLDGHLVTIPNGELANLLVENVSKRPYIKRVLEVGITYDTPIEKVQQARTILEEILHEHEGYNKAYPPRVYFKTFNASSLDLIAIYWYHPADYWAYMHHADQVNMDVLSRFNEAGIEFAFPSQTLYFGSGQTLADPSV